MSVRRVAVTGLGVVSAIGNDPETFFGALCEGDSGVAPRQRWQQEGLARVNAAEVERDEVLAQLGEEERRLPWACAMGLVAARQALADAGLGPVLGLGGLYVNSILGAPATLTGACGRWRDADFVAPELTTRDSHGARVAAVAAALGAGAEVQASVVPCAGNVALGSALDAVRAGRVACALAGGMEEMTTASYAAFHRIRVLADRCQPFDRDRAGMVIGEGAAFLLLEPLAAAEARGARIYAELLGVGYSNDAHDLVAPAPDGGGAGLALRRALDEAGLVAGQVDHVNAHGTGTALNDEAEAQALVGLFGDELAGVRISSTKGATGHAMGAASAIEAVATVLATQRGSVPPTVGLETPDPQWGEALAASLTRPGPHSIRVALSSGFGLGGNNAVAAFGAPGVGNPAWVERPVFLRRAATLAAGELGVEALARRVREGRTPRADERRYGFDPRALLGPKRLRHADRATVLLGAVVETQLAPWPEPISPGLAGVVVGVAHPSFGSSLTVMRRLQRGGEPRLNPGAVPHSTANSSASYLAIRTGVTGLNATLASGECAGLDAIAYASEQIRRGRLGRALAAGVSGHNEELWQGLGATGREELCEAAAVVDLSDERGGAWAEVLASAHRFAPQEPDAAAQGCAADALARAGLETVDLWISASGSPPSQAHGAEVILLAAATGDTLAAGGALAVALAGHLLARGDATSALICQASPEGFASAMVLAGVKAP